MKGLLKIAFAVAGAGLGVMLTTKYVLKGTVTNADGSTTTSGFIEASGGYGLDDVAQGAGALAGAWAGHKLAGMLFKGG